MPINFSAPSATNSVIEFIKDRLYFTWSSQDLSSQNVHSSDSYYFSIDNILVYQPFFADFGPPNVAHLYRFIMIMRNKLVDASLHKKKLFLFSSTDHGKRANAAYLISAYSMLERKRSPEEAYKPLIGATPSFMPFRDAGQGTATYFITIIDCLKALKKAIDLQLFSYDQFDLQEYEKHERVEMGDFNWITPKFIAFASPQDDSCHGGDGNLYGRMSTCEVAELFRQKQVTAVVRLNNKLYNKSAFTSRGMHHYELYFQDGSCPPEHILVKFLALCKAHNGTIAVHCKAGLGRTGSLIGAWLMMTYQFTASEVIAIMRLMRPGCVVGPQQNYLHSMQQRLWKMRESETNFASVVSTRPVSRELNLSEFPMDVEMTSNRPYEIPAQPRKGIDTNPEYLPATFAYNYTTPNDDNKPRRQSLSTISSAGTNLSQSGLDRKAFAAQSAVSSKSRPSSAIISSTNKKRDPTTTASLNERRAPYGV